jgi:retron-type reverse transcriptase
LTDLPRNQFGFRPNLDAKMAVRRAYSHITQSGRTDVVDVDLSKYFGSIPHRPLMRCVARRVADGTLLSIIKAWLGASVPKPSIAWRFHALTWFGCTL